MISLAADGRVNIPVSFGRHFCVNLRSRRLPDGEKYLVELYTLANFTDMSKEHLTDRPVADWNFAWFGVSRAVGGGEEKDGREVEGLGVLVQRQGAKGVLASLWPVNDESTGRFMRLFYGYRQQAGLSKAGALRKAQQAFIEGRAD